MSRAAVSTLWEPRIGPVATRMRLRSDWARRIAAVGLPLQLGCWPAALYFLQSAHPWPFWPLTVLALTGLIGLWTGLVLLLRWSRQLQQAANDHWGVAAAVAARRVAPVPVDDVVRFDAWRARHPEWEPRLD